MALKWAHPKTYIFRNILEWFLNRFERVPSRSLQMAPSQERGRHKACRSRSCRWRTCSSLPGQTGHPRSNEEKPARGERKEAQSCALPNDPPLAGHSSGRAFSFVYCGMFFTRVDPARERERERGTIVRSRTRRSTPASPTLA